jgi:hypothetical protein
LELGRFLVKEYLDERNNDTLSRWLLHAIAERIAKIEQSKGTADSLRVENETIELILKLWAHRAVGPRGADPLKRYDPVLKAFRSLLPGANPWESREAGRNDRLAYELYRSLTMLTLSLLRVGLDLSEKRSAKERALHNKFLPANEAAVLLQFEQIENLVYSSDRSVEPAVNDSESGAAILDVSEAVRSWAERTVELSQEILTMFKNVSISREITDNVRKVRDNAKPPTMKAPTEKSKIQRSRSAFSGTVKQTPKKTVSKKSGKAPSKKNRK